MSKNYTITMPEKSSQPRAKYPSCGKIITLGRRYQRLEMVVCPNCQQTMEVVKVFPQVLNYPEDPSNPSSGRKYLRQK